MDPRLSNSTQSVRPPGRIEIGQPLGPTARRTDRDGGFKGVLEAALATEPVRFSKHAAERVSERQIALTPADVNRLTMAVNSAAEKGARDSLILMNRAAFVVNVPNRTVITAVDEKHMRENVFTNIDSAIILN